MYFSGLHAPVNFQALFVHSSSELSCNNVMLSPIVNADDATRFEYSCVCEHRMCVSELNKPAESMLRVRELTIALPRPIFIVARYLFAFLNQ